jgi:hypothetical protein
LGYGKFPIPRQITGDRKMKKYVICLICVIAAAYPLNAKQELEKSYPIIPMRHYTIKSIVGDITVSGYKGKEIKVIASKEGPDNGKIEIAEKNLGPNGIELSSDFPKFRNDKIKVNFEVKVPESEVSFTLELKSYSGMIDVSKLKLKGSLFINTFQGDVRVENVNGDVLFIDTFQGNVKVENVNGNILAKSGNGSMNVGIKQPDGRMRMRFESWNGNIKVTAPSDLEARVMMRTSGNLQFDYPLKQMGGRYEAKVAGGKLGAATQQIDISSAYGSVSLLKK